MLRFTGTNVRSAEDDYWITMVRDWLQRCPLSLELTARLLFLWPDRFVSQLKYVPGWYRSFRTSGGEFIPRPWLPYECVEWLEDYLDEDKHVFEYGSGGSTVFFAHRVHRIDSVEHDPDWYERVRQYLREQDINNVNLMLEEPEPREEQPGAFGSAKEPYRQCSFQRYAESIESLDDPSVDLVLVDGRARMDCLSVASEFIKPGGYLLLDDAQRDRYSRAGSRLGPTLTDTRNFDGLKPATRGRAITKLFRKQS